MRDTARAWFAAATSTWTDWPPEQLDKGASRISVVIPARNEEATIGGIVAAIRSELVDRTGLVDELVVIDSDSTDRTAARAAAEGAVVHASRDVAPHLGTHPGKGEALWKSQFVTSGDVLVFIDADLTEWGPHFVTGLVGPLLADPAVELVKGFYDRILDDGSGRQATAGGRVTELVARPLLNLFWPDLAALVQPLAGEWAIRRSLFGALSVPVGYGVELAAVLDTYAAGGLRALAQVDLGARAHTHQAEHDLAVMAAELLITAEARTPHARVADPSLAQFSREGWREREIPYIQREPANSHVWMM